jgi:hypothetical protein
MQLCFNINKIDVVAFEKMFLMGLPFVFQVSSGLSTFETGKGLTNNYPDTI